MNDGNDVTAYFSNLSVFRHCDLAALEDFELLGDIFAFIGKIVVEEIAYLLLVTECSELGQIETVNASFLRIEKVCALPVLTDGMIHKKLFDMSPLDNLERLKSRPKDLLKLVSHKVPIKNLPTSPKLIEEIVAFFNQPKSFYFALNFDITKTLQRGCLESVVSDNRFFWNKDLLKELFVNNGTPIPAFKEWITPVIYGFIEHKSIVFDVDVRVHITLISRRSVKRAGVRYLRRGIDENGDVANFVETEFIVCVFGHCLSFVQCRGSVPVFWSQKGFQLKPPLVIDRPLDISLPIFASHIKHLTSIYGTPLTLVNLVDESGKEASLGEVYLQHVLSLDSSDVAYHSFDFHRICGNRGHHKLSELMATLDKSISAIGYCWVDKSGQMVLRQKGIVRTNCVDCLDRTNVVQSAIALIVCLNQCRKLGIVEPISEAPMPLTRTLQQMWADHGDFISKQYTGTSALKGDITRSGQRKLTGMTARELMFWDSSERIELEGS
uniref:SAC domain-containing protein n=1 Tax=Globodera rostochiensis TaxID=31243 RepID=A0A914HMP0_GLORO